jgi:Fe-S cluster biogenesis protein NfuA
MHEDKEFQQRIQRVEGLVRKVESLSDPDARASAIELMQSVMDLHGEGLGRMMEIVRRSAGAESEIIHGFARDELISGLLLLYGLHPLNFETRVLEAVEKLQPYMRSHGASLEMVAVTGGDVRLRLEVSGHGCGSSAQGLKAAIEDALYEAAPDMTSLEVEGGIEQQTIAGFVPIEQLRVKCAR